MKKIYILLMLILFTSFSNEVTLNLKFDKYFNEELNSYVYITKNMNIREEASTKSKIISKAKPKDKLPLLEEVLDSKGKTTWYKIKIDGKEGYVFAKNNKKRGFDWQNASEEANKINDMILEGIKENKKIYYLDYYQSLLLETDGVDDKYGNSANQSIKAYYDNNKYINLQDRALVFIEREDDKYIYIKTLSYGDDIYKVSKKFKKRFKESKLDKLVNKFIYIDRNSQTQITLERNEDNIYNVNAVGYITSGVAGGYGFVTPYGDFLVAYTKPIMKYASDTQTEEVLDSKENVVKKKPVIIGEAKMAIRFSGGGYLHGIPATYGDNIEARKKYTESKLGTVELSHKCVRHADDLINYVYDWVNEGAKRDKKSGFIYPLEPVIVIVR